MIAHRRVYYHRRQSKSKIDDPSPLLDVLHLINHNESQLFFQRHTSTKLFLMESPKDSRTACRGSTHCDRSARLVQRLNRVVNLGWSLRYERVGIVGVATCMYPEMTPTSRNRAWHEFFHALPLLWRLIRFCQYYLVHTTCSHDRRTISRFG